MAYEHWHPGGTVKLTTDEEHESLGRNLEEETRRIDTVTGKLWDETGKLWKELEGKASYASQAKLWETLEKEKQAFTEQLDGLRGITDGIERRIKCSEFEKEICAMFQRQFARLEEACKKYTTAKTALILAADGVFNDIEARKRNAFEELRAQTDALKERSKAESEKEISAIFQEQFARLEDTWRLSLAELQNQADALKEGIKAEWSGVFETLNAIQQGQERDREARIAAIKYGEDMIATIQNAQALMKTSQDIQSEKIQYLQDFNGEIRGRGWQAFWRRICWLLIGEKTRQSGNLPS